MTPSSTLWLRLIGIVLSVLTVAACAPEAEPETAIPGRWYSVEQVARGRTLFQQYCAVCHGERAQGTGDWKKTDANGNYPPPPLNGTAHAWHHPTEVLQRTIANGGVPLGGTMPAFGAVIDPHEALDVIAYFQSFWPDDVYSRWLEIEKR